MIKKITWPVLVLIAGGFAVANDHSGAAAPAHAPAAGGGHSGGSLEISTGKSAFEVETLLREGNMRYVQETASYPNQGINRRHETVAKGQHPMATILTCSDSRVPPEYIFDQGIGDIFVIRVAGNIADPAEIATIEYGTGHLGTPLVMVLGHTKCGAVTAAATRAEAGGNLPSLIDNIMPAVAATEKANPGVRGDDLIGKTIKQNVWQTIEDILRQSAETRKLIREGKVKLVGALYDIESGEVQNLGVHINQDNLLKKYR
jgi:carbonic anhydrase